MNWKKIDDYSDFDKDCDILFKGEYNTNIDYYLGWCINGQINVEDAVNRDSISLIKATKLFGLTHYCIITPPEV